MFDFVHNLTHSGPNGAAPRPSLYCVWIPAHEGENAPLIQIWIDPSMSAFDSPVVEQKTDLVEAQNARDANS
jgi:hypothetical protein